MNHEHLWRLEEKLVAAAEELGYAERVGRSKVSPSGSRYTTLAWDREALDEWDDAEDIRIRFSDHPRSLSAKLNHAAPDLSIANDAELAEVVQILKERKVTAQ